MIPPYCHRSTRGKPVAGGGACEQSYAPRSSVATQRFITIIFDRVLIKSLPRSRKRLLGTALRTFHRLPPRLSGDRHRGFANVARDFLYLGVLRFGRRLEGHDDRGPG